MTIEEKQFCEELQELLDRYKAILFPPAIMRNAQRIFRNTLSIKQHPALYPQGYIESNLETLERFVTEGPKAEMKCQWVDELKEKEEL